MCVYVKNCVELCIMWVCMYVWKCVALSCIVPELCAMLDYWGVVCLCSNLSMLV